MMKTRSVYKGIVDAARMRTAASRGDDPEGVRRR